MVFTLLNSVFGNISAITKLVSSNCCNCACGVLQTFYCIKIHKSQLYGSTTVVMAIYGLHGKWRSLTPCERHPSLHLCQYVFPHVITTMAASKSFSSVASGIWNALPNHLSSIPTLPVFRRALKHHLFLLAYPDSGAKSGKIKPAQCISLCDTVPTTAIPQPVNTMPPI